MKKEIITLQEWYDADGHLEENGIGGITPGGGGGLGDETPEERAERLRRWQEQQKKKQEEDQKKKDEEKPTTVPPKPINNPNPNSHDGKGTLINIKVKPPNRNYLRP